MPGRHRETAATRPSPVSVHDHGDRPSHVGALVDELGSEIPELSDSVEKAHQARILLELSRNGPVRRSARWRTSDLEDLLLLALEELIDLGHAPIRVLL